MEIKIKLKKSKIGVPKKQVRILKALGLGKVGSEVTKPNNPVFRGMIKKVIHLVDFVEEKGK